MRHIFSMIVDVGICMHEKTHRRKNKETAFAACQVISRVVFLSLVGGKILLTLPEKLCLIKGRQDIVGSA